MDSILVAQTVSKNNRHQNTYNLNYRFDAKKGRNFNVDLDYGHFTNDGRRSQPNAYLNATEDSVLSRVINNFETPTDIKIYTFKADYEQNLLGGAISLGTKFSKVVSDNTFLVFDELSGLQVRDDKRSNLFKYDENVYAAYVNYQRPLSKNWSASAGLSTEQTNASGDLQAFLPELQEPPVILDYLSWFPSVGLNWSPSSKHSINLNYGKRINRPDYNVLNPFNNQLSQLSFRKGKSISPT
ncbi:MAG: TonB-dependent receptor family protein [Saprospiraceae bacterium]|nr:TonB-dependent receptor family protein [Candidatus Vicinibacter affinis]